MSINVRPFDANAAPQGSSSGERRTMQDQEEELILTAWRHMSTVLHKHGFTEEPRLPGPAQSFLARQRLSTLRPKYKT
ncbi:protein Hook homolog 2-like [Periophthalmus magnuspinnatus]|uniref:protein Hook homolog 2-like n=1 Tax=Periophthalmus magnuspinnatus TaxID=409849 RepID=UPI0024367EBC|nr:protein Hook homolog 2-like [Periophthalmus magnuspinnatus]